LINYFLVILLYFFLFCKFIFSNSIKSILFNFVKNYGCFILKSEELNLSFSFKHLESITKNNVSDLVNIGLSKDIPLIVSYSFQNDGYLRYFLAPKIDDDN